MTRFTDMNPYKMSKRELRLHVLGLRLSIETQGDRIEELEYENRACNSLLRHNGITATNEIEELESQLDADVVSLQQRVDMLTEKLHGYAVEVLRRDEQIAVLKGNYENQKQMLFIAAGHISKAEKPSQEGLMFATDIFEHVSADRFPTPM